MMVYSICIKVPKKSGEKSIALASRLNILNRELKIYRDNENLYIPLIREPTDDEIKILKEHIPDLEVTVQQLQAKDRKSISIMDLLADKLPPHLLASLPRAIDFVGDIAIVEIPPELDSYKAEIGEAILNVHKNVRTVLAKAGAISGVYRTRKYEVIAGETKTETIHKEYGCRYHVDVTKVYFSPRLSYERYRIAQLVRGGETIVDMFAGVGPFSILIAKKHANVKIYAIDINPNAIALLERNVRLNRVDARVYPILGDAGLVIEQKLKGVADRVIMNLPEKAIEFVGSACKAIKSQGGVIHFYSFATPENTIESVADKFKRKVEETGRKVERIISTRVVRETAPYEWQVVIDAQIT
ncbi:MAG: class I SAM-dependent methyltransferase family protein [Candidatus Bathyarchaeia archaeon]